ncbi:popeye domain-containing protein 3-like [Daphnia pulex]|uniref:popeye domain-containing protein 3-like n=1 Tax=Daphnia pulex TaxID=6669 RepID=UPI001EDD84ED|nr:popeye domain-containing protein 3-like [Daphnia pulex]XP_046640165.1 popeye domain-containing protein 3-like [Daphnia pulicaria]
MDSLYLLPSEMGGENVTEKTDFDIIPVFKTVLAYPHNDSLQFNDIFNMSWGRFFMPCENWHEPQHILFQLAYGCFFISCLTPDNSIGILVMHAVLLLGGLLYSTWAWNMMCAPDIFSWTFGFVFLNFCQLLYDLYRIRPVRLDPEVEAVFALLFQPLGISRTTFKKLVGPEYAEIFTLHPGDFYALQNLTRIDRLSIVLSGKVQVVSDGTTLHTIDANEFLDSPEFESSRASVEDKFRVSIIATGTSRYISWQRSTLEYLFVKETVLANVFCVLVARDVINKVFAMNKKLASQRGHLLDIRLPGIASCLYDSSRETSPTNISSDLSPPLKSHQNGGMSILSAESHQTFWN